MDPATGDRLLNSEDECRWRFLSRPFVAAEGHRWRLTTRRHTMVFDRIVLAIRILVTPRSSRFREDVATRPIAHQSSPLMFHSLIDLTSVKRWWTGLFRALLFFFLSAWFRSRRITCRSGYVLRRFHLWSKHLWCTSSMRRWKWVIRSLTEIFDQDFALVP